jgi:hypothetical protein
VEAQLKNTTLAGQRLTRCASEPWTATHHSWWDTSHIATLTCGAVSPLPAHSALPVAMTSLAALLASPPAAVGSVRAATMVRSRLSTASTDAIDGQYT